MSKEKGTVCTAISSWATWPRGCRGEGRGEKGRKRFPKAGEKENTKISRSYVWGFLWQFSGEKGACHLSTVRPRDPICSGTTGFTSWTYCSVQKRQTGTYSWPGCAVSGGLWFQPKCTFALSHCMLRHPGKERAGWSHTAAWSICPRFYMVKLGMETRSFHLLRGSHLIRVRN